MSLINFQNDAINIDPKRILIFASPKVGKTTAVSGLGKDAVLIDFEDGSGYIKGTNVINVLDIVGKRLNIPPKEVPNNYKALGECINVIREVVEELRQLKPKYVVLDSVTALIKIATYLATENYKKSAVGKNYTGFDVVKDLANGAGYEWLREAFGAILSALEPQATKCSILIGHVKDASIIKAQVGDVSARDIQLTGKLKQIICQNADAIGYMYRKTDKDLSITMLSFENDERDLVTGSRSEHLSNKVIPLVEESPKGSRNFVFNWNKIFISNT